MATCYIYTMLFYAMLCYFIVSDLLLHSCCVRVFVVSFGSLALCISLGEKEQKILNNLLNEFNLQPTGPRYNSVVQLGITSVLPKVFIWCPKQHFQIDSTCSCTMHEIAMAFHCWTSNLNANSFCQPRLVYDLFGNIIFVQAIYRCPYISPDSSSCHDYHSASTEILAILPPHLSQQFPFKLFYRSACSQDLMDYVIVHIGRGHNFLELAEDIASLNFRAFSHQHRGNSHDADEYYANIVYGSPSNDQLMYIFLAYFNSIKNTFENELATTPCSILTCDHTCKVSKHIGIVRSADKAFVN